LIAPSRIDIPEKTEGANKNRQSRENRRQSRIDNPEKTERTIKNRQSRENRRGNQE
jgi:hypothetical protein